MRPRGAFEPPTVDVRVHALAAGITMFELARIMGTSAKMIEQHYGTLIDTAHDAIFVAARGDPVTLARGGVTTRS